jgi:hypothetical protein
VCSQSALTLLTCLANSDLLAMVPAQWGRFKMTGDALSTIRIEEDLTAPPLVLVRRADLLLTPAAASARPDAAGNVAFRGRVTCIGHAKLTAKV